MRKTNLFSTSTKNKSKIKTFIETFLSNAFILLPLHILTLIQRLPFIIFFLILSSVFFVLYRITRKNMIAIIYFRFSLIFYFFLNGIWLSLDPKIKELRSNIFIINYAAPIDFLIHYIMLPLQKIVILPDIYFNFYKNRQKFCFYLYIIDGLVSIFKENYRSLYYMLGFLPRENFSIQDFKQKEFFVEKYLDNDFYLCETANFDYEPYQQIPFSLMLAIKKQKPVYILEMIGSDQSIYSSFFFPRKIKVKIKGVIEANPDVKIMVESYYQLLNA
ncbi:MAG: hypothetical protein WC860_08030 [Candidatus Margulisiibacteriota bacterium]|jgi:hypothetical protein